MDVEIVKDIVMLFTISGFCISIILIFSFKYLERRFQKNLADILKKSKDVKKGLSKSANCFFKIYKYRRKIVYLIFLLALVFALLLIYLEVFFTGSYVTYEAMTGFYLTIIMIFLISFFHLNSRIDRILIEVKR